VDFLGADRHQKNAVDIAGSLPPIACRPRFVLSDQPSERLYSLTAPQLPNPPPMRRGLFAERSWPTPPSLRGRCPGAKSLRWSRTSLASPITLSAFHQQCARGDGPPVAAQWGNRLLYAPDVVRRWARQRSQVQEAS
jgi:hypothetical protein